MEVVWHVQCVMMDVCGKQGTAGLLKLSPSVTVTVPLPKRDSCSEKDRDTAGGPWTLLSSMHNPT